MPRPRKPGIYGIDTWCIGRQATAWYIDTISRGIIAMQPIQFTPQGRCLHPKPHIQAEPAQPRPQPHTFFGLQSVSLRQLTAPPMAGTKLDRYG